MNAELIRRWNSVVTPKDTVYVLGDVALCKPEQALAFVYGLNGTKYLIAGNHDKPNRKKYEASGAFEWVKDYAEIKVDDSSGFTHHVVMSHFPFLSWNRSGHGSFHLHGHCHGNLKDDPHALRIDVGVDCHNYAPISVDEVAAIMGRKTWKPIDHHGAD
jgi:calcineurin-like phosphoesterase family protein